MLRRARPWHPYAHQIRVLPDRIEALSGRLGLAAGARVLDLGCGDMRYRSFFAPGVEVVGADLPGNPVATVDIQPDGTVPVPDGTFDAVLSTQVLEHVADPAVYLAEAARVLRPGGRMLLSTHGVFFYHPDPIDRWRWTCDGLRTVVGAAGFEVVEFEGIVGSVPTGLQMVQDGVSLKLPRPLRPVFAYLMQALVAFTDARQSARSKALNAAIFALVAERR